MNGRFACALVVLIATGCYRSPNPAASFAQVQRDVSQRSRYTVQWDRYGQAEQQIYCWITQKLQRKLSLDDAIHIALLNNPSLRATYENLGIAQANLTQADLLQNPSFNLSYNEIILLQNVVDLLLRPLKQRLAYAELVKARHQVTGDVIQVIEETKAAYYSHQAVTKILALQEELVATKEAAYEMALRLREAGNLTCLQLALEKNQYEMAKMELSAKRVMMAEVEALLHTLMGLDKCQVGWQLAEHLRPPPKESVSADSLSQNLALQIARQDIRIAAAKKGINIAERVFPDAGLGPDFNWDPVVQYGPGVTFSLPLFDRGVAQKALGDAEIRQKWHEYVALVRKLQAQVRLHHVRLMQARGQFFHASTVLVPLAEKTLQETLLQYNAMQLGVFDLLRTKSEEISARITCLTKWGEYWIARADMEALIKGKHLQQEWP